MIPRLVSPLTVASQDTYVCELNNTNQLGTRSHTRLNNLQASAAAVATADVVADSMTIGVLADTSAAVGEVADSLTTSGVPEAVATIVGATDSLTATRV